MFRLLLLALGLLALAAPARAAEPKPLEVEVIRTSAASLHVNIALIKGERKAVLVDAPFTLADAHRVVAAVLDSGKELETIFVTHDHPDHFFAMEVLTEAFPSAKVVAHPVVVADIWRSLPFKVKRWSPMLGPNGPRTPTAPAPLAGDTILLEGRELNVIGPVQGDHLHATALWAPSIRALFPGDLVYNRMFMWTGEHGPAEVAAWRKALDQLAALQPQLVVPGHDKPGLPYDATALEWSRRYLADWEKAVAASNDSADLRRRITAQYPDTIDALGDFILGTSSRVAKGEEPRWTE